MKNKFITTCLALSACITMSTVGVNIVSANESFSRNQLYSIESAKTNLNLDVEHMVPPTIDKGSGIAYRITPMIQMPKNNTDGQKFMLVQLDGGYYVLANKLDGSVSDTKYAHYLKTVGNGALLWRPIIKLMYEKDVLNSDWTGGSEQQWNIVKLNGDKYKFVSRLNSEVLEVPYGNQKIGQEIVTYQDIGAENQQWRIEQAEKLPMPSETKIEQLSDIPHYKSYSDHLPLNTKPTITASTLIPYFMVNDTWSSKDKINKTPYYKLVKKQYWHKLHSHVFSPGRELKFTSKYGISKSSVEIMKDKLGFVTKIDGSINFGGKDAKVSGALAISETITKELETTRSNTTNESTEKIEENLYKNNTAEQVAWTKYALVTEYHLERADGTLVADPWKVIQDNDTRETTWPDKRRIDYSPIKVEEK